MDFREFLASDGGDWRHKDGEEEEEVVNHPSDFAASRAKHLASIVIIFTLTTRNVILGIVPKLRDVNTQGQLDDLIGGVTAMLTLDSRVMLAPTLENCAVIPE